MIYYFENLNIPGLFLNDEEIKQYIKNVVNEISKKKKNGNNSELYFILIYTIKNIAKNLFTGNVHIFHWITANSLYSNNVYFHMVSNAIECLCVHPLLVYSNSNHLTEFVIQCLGLGKIPQPSL